MLARLTEVLSRFAEAHWWALNSAVALVSMAILGVDLGGLVSLPVSEWLWVSMIVFAVNVYYAWLVHSPPQLTVSIPLRQGIDYVYGFSKTGSGEPVLLRRIAIRNDSRRHDAKNVTVTIVGSDPDIGIPSIEVHRMGDNPVVGAPFATVHTVRHLKTEFFDLISFAPNDAKQLFLYRSDGKGDLSDGAFPVPQDANRRFNERLYADGIILDVLILADTPGRNLPLQRFRAWRSEPEMTSFDLARV